MIHDKIPHNVRTTKTRDAVTPSVKGLQGVIPSTVGIAAKARFKRIVGTLGAATLALDSIIKIKDDPNASPDDIAAADAALANVNKIIPKLAAAADSLMRAQGKAPNAEASAQHANTAQTNAPHDPAMDVALGSIHNPLILDARRIELTRERAAEMLGAINPERVRQGLPDEPATSYDILKSAK